jgi:hypothetical protein
MRSMSLAGKSEPHAVPKLFSPSAEVAAKMQPVSRNAFESLLKRAANSPALKLAPRAK